MQVPTSLRKARLLTAYPGAIVRRPGAALRYLLHDREFTNLTYEIENESELAETIASAIDHPFDEIAAYVAVRTRYELIIGDVRRTLPEALAGGVDMFVHDSLHTYEHERFELRAAAGAGATVLVSDNSHVSPALEEVCRDRHLRYSLFLERPRDHFYPGAGLGIGAPAR